MLAAAGTLTALIALAFLSAVPWLDNQGDESSPAASVFVAIAVAGFGFAHRLASRKRQDLREAFSSLKREWRRLETLSGITLAVAANNTHLHRALPELASREHRPASKETGRRWGLRCYTAIEKFNNDLVDAMSDGCRSRAPDVATLRDLQEAFDRFESALGDFRAAAFQYQYLTACHERVLTYFRYWRSYVLNDPLMRTENDEQTQDRKVFFHLTHEFIDTLGRITYSQRHFSPAITPTSPSESAGRLVPRRTQWKDWDREGGQSRGQFYWLHWWTFFAWNLRSSARRQVLADVYTWSVTLYHIRQKLSSIETFEDLQSEVEVQRLVLALLYDGHPDSGRGPKPWPTGLFPQCGVEPSSCLPSRRVT